MGLLSSLINKSVRKAENQISNSIGNAIGNAIGNSITNSLGLKPASSEQAQASISAAEEALQNTAKEIETAANEYRAQVVPKLTVVHSNQFPLAMDAVGSDIAFHGSPDYFADIIAKNIPGANVAKNVALSAITSQLPYKQANIDILITSGSKRIAIFIMPKDKYRNACYVFSMNACEAAGVSAIRFMKEFRNDPEYVIGRIRSLL